MSKKKKDNFRDGDEKRPWKSWQKSHGKRTVGSRRSSVEEAWLRIKDHLDEIGRLHENGVALVRIAETFGVRRSALSELRKRKPELEKVLADSAGAREDLIVSDMWRLARGTATSVEETEMRDSLGKLRGSQKKTIRPLPNLNAQLALLKHHHGWSDNPKVDDAVVNTLNNKDWTAKISLIPGFSDLSPKSSEADNFRAPEAPEVSPLSHEVGPRIASPRTASSERFCPSPRPSPKGEGDVPQPRKSLRSLQGTDPNPEGSGPDASGDATGVENERNDDDYRE